MATDRTWEVTKGQVRRDFAYIRQLMRTADKMMRDQSTDYSIGGDFEQLSQELIGCASTLNAYIEQQRKYSGDNSDERNGYTL